MTQETLSLIMQGLITLITGGTLGGVLTWYSGRKKRRIEYRSEINSALEEVQETVNMLADKNGDLYEVILRLRDRDAERGRQMLELKLQNDMLSQQMSDVLEELEYIRQLYESETGKPAPNKPRKKKITKTSTQDDAE